MSIFNKIFNETKINCEVIGLTNNLKCLYTYNLFMKNKKSIVVVVNTLYEATNFYQIMANYTDDVLLFPMDDFITSEAVAISPELKTTRLETLYDLAHGENKIIITNLMGYLRFLPPVDLYKEKIISIKQQQEYRIKDLIDNFFAIGYSRETLVNKTGEMAPRGYVVDIFPINASSPIRIEFWGDTIESIREFDINDQRTIKEINEVTIAPNTEFLINQKEDITFKKQNELNSYYKPSSISEYCVDKCIIYNDYNQLKTSYNMLLEEIFNYNLNLKRPSDYKYMHTLNDIKIEEYIYFSDFMSINKNSKCKLEYFSNDIEPFSGNVESINKRLIEYLKNKKQVVICVSNKNKASKLMKELAADEIILTTEKEIFDNKINVIIKNISSGFELKQIVVISEKEIFNIKDFSYKYKTNFRMGTKIKDVNRLNIGDYIVHGVHGIGRYCGLKTLSQNGLKKDYIYLEYRGGDKLYIPVEQIDLISKYSSSDGIIPKVNKLGSTEWERTKQKVRKKIESIASELIKLYATRESEQGFAFNKDYINQLEFEKEFPYEETPDQLRVTEEIKRDMEKPVPMDRLLCGDVGYGKTEVAFRAIFKAIISNKQVAYLCPTTILSNQQYMNAIERFSSYPVNIALLNRFVTKKETDRIIKEIKEGKIDVVIGTHKLLNKNIHFKDLGLLIIDEEQRFGVKHKEIIKQYKNNIDVLTLTATPIPRTLQMAMSGIRNLSLIETPPINRYPIQTYVVEEDEQIIKDAIYKELSRKGQVFLLYNKVENIDLKVRQISKLVPDAKVIAAHGQMNKKELEDVMLKFINKDYDVLVCTTIIETGIDIPSANTLIILDADRFGLSQLYQIRGRVGRSDKIAYCYLMYNKQKVLSEVATKRLKVIKDFTELGSGFAIAARDLSIRGAGDILGSEQAGYIDSVGVELFLKMLNEEVENLKDNKPKIEEVRDDGQPVLNIETAIDNNYVADEELKIEIHKKISEIESKEKLLATMKELEDRFGKIPDKTILYMYEELFDKIAKKLKITNIKQTKNFVEIIVNKELSKQLDIEELFIEASKISRMFRFSIKHNRLIITLDIVKLDKHFVYYLIELFQIISDKCKKS